MPSERAIDCGTEMADAFEAKHGSNETLFQDEACFLARSETASGASHPDGGQPEGHLDYVGDYI